MKFILDASTALKWVLNEANSRQARRLRDEYRRHAAELLAPDTFVVEVAHALTKAERRRAIRVGEAVVLLGDIMSTRPGLEPYLPFVPRAVELSSVGRIGVYDCLYVALAEWEDCKILTDDHRLLKAFPAHVIGLAALP